VSEGPSSDRTPGATAPGGAVGALGARLTHDTALYTGGAFAGFALTLVNVVVLTHYLPPAEFGELALLMVFAAFLTVIYNVSILQGTFMSVFGAAGEEDVEEDETKPAAANKRRALGTGLVLTATLSALGTALIVPLAPDLAERLLGERSDGDLIIVAAASGAAGAMWRMFSNVLRMERRPYGYLALSLVRPLLVIGTVIPLVANGGGVSGAIVGTAIGSGAAVIVALFVTRRSFVFAFNRSDIRMILRRGVSFVPIVVSFWIVQNVDLIALARYLPDTEVGLYRLAGRFGAFVHYFTAALFMAWGPTARTSTFAAAAKERGKDVLGGTLLTYLVVTGALLLLGMTVAADGLVRIAPPAYEDAAPLIPVLAGGFLAHGLLVAIYRVSSFPHKRGAYVGSAVLSAVVFVALAPILIPWLGAYGAALSVIGGFLAAVIAVGVLSQHGPTPIRIEYGRIAASTALFGLCLALAKAAEAWAGTWAPLIELAALVLYPVLLLASGVIPRHEREGIAEALRGALALPRRSPELEARLGRLRPDDLADLELAVSGGRTLAELASASGDHESEVSARLVGAMRRLAELGEGTGRDEEIGQYLFSQMSVAERDEEVRALWSGEVEPSELHALESTLEGLRRLPSSAWETTRDDRGVQAGPTH
jgi:O-antigen/teichoic acid export membrane protein